MFDTPKSDITTVLVDEDMVRGLKEAEYMRRSPLTDETVDDDDVGAVAQEL